MSRKNQAERDWDDLQNEGADGYNPHRDARLSAKPESPKSIVAQINDLDSRLYYATRRANAITRINSDEDYAAKVEAAKSEIAAIESEIAALRAKQDAEYLVEWTLDITTARRAAWNAAVRAMGPGLIDRSDVLALERKMGHTGEDLKRALKLHGLI